MSYPFVRAWYDYGPRPYPTLGLMFHMAEGGGTVKMLADAAYQRSVGDSTPTPPKRGVSVHAVCENDGRVVQMLDWTHASGSLNPSDRSVDTGYYGHTALVEVLGDRWTDPNKVVLSMEIQGFAADGPNAKQVAGAIAWGLDMKRHFPELRGALGHTDQTDTKACPGLSASMKAIFAGVGGHGLWGAIDVTPAAITDETEKLVTTKPLSVWYELDGKTARSTGHPALTMPRTSPFGVGSKRAIYVNQGTNPVIRSLVLVVPATVTDPPAPDCKQAVADGKAAQHEADRTEAIRLASQL